MSEPDFPTVNGIAPSWADIETVISVNGGSVLETKDYSAINFSRAVEIGRQKGSNGGRTKKRTTGDASEEASATWYLDGAKQLKRALIAAAPTRGGQISLSLATFNLVVQFTPPGEVEIQHFEIRGCRISGDTFAFAEGSEASTVEIALNPAQVVEIIDGQEVVLL